MRSISVDFTNQGSSASSSLAGYVDEHDATEISFNLPSEITDNTDIEEIPSNKVTYAYEDEINTISDVEAALNLIFCNLSNIYIETTQSDDGATIKIVNKDGTSSTVSLSNGQNGSTPQKGIDYWTESDIAEIKSYVDDVILGGKW